MAQSERESLSGPSIEAMLRGLTERPNVQSTLILSRKDGSIIRATGIGGSGERGFSARATTNQWSQARESPGGPEKSEKDLLAGDKQAESADAQPGAKPVEILASSIFQFVNNANALGCILGATSRDGTRLNGPPAMGAREESMDASKGGRTTEEDAENGPSEDQVQLLRLRTKHQEIIIFPDPNYLCCVVQRVGKAGIVHDGK